MPRRTARQRAGAASAPAIPTARDVNDDDAPAASVNALLAVSEEQSPGLRSLSGFIPGRNSHAASGLAIFSIPIRILSIG
jgi:hypothetical protein